jgi:hypothetical protein
VQDKAKLAAAQRFQDLLSEVDGPAAAAELIIQPP